MITPEQWTEKGGKPLEPDQLPVPREDLQDQLETWTPTPAPELGLSLFPEQAAPRQLAQLLVEAESPAQQEAPAQHALAAEELLLAAFRQVKAPWRRGEAQRSSLPPATGKAAGVEVTMTSEAGEGAQHPPSQQQASLQAPESPQDAEPPSLQQEPPAGPSEPSMEEGPSPSQQVVPPEPPDPPPAQDGTAGPTPGRHQAHSRPSPSVTPQPKDLELTIRSQAPNKAKHSAAPRKTASPPMQPLLEASAGNTDGASVKAPQSWKETSGTEPTVPPDRGEGNRLDVVENEQKRGQRSTTVPKTPRSTQRRRSKKARGDSHRRTPSTRRFAKKPPASPESGLISHVPQPASSFSEDLSSLEKLLSELYLSSFKGHIPTTTVLNNQDREATVATNSPTTRPHLPDTLSAGDQYERWVYKEMKPLINNKIARKQIAHALRTLNVDCPQTYAYPPCVTLMEKIRFLMWTLKDLQGFNLSKADLDALKGKSENESTEDQGGVNWRTLFEFDEPVTPDDYNTKFIIAIAMFGIMILLVILVCIMELCFYIAARVKKARKKETSIRELTEVIVETPPSPLSSEESINGMTGGRYLIHKSLLTPTPRVKKLNT